jgi:fatty acid desaturase
MVDDRSSSFGPLRVQLHDASGLSYREFRAKLSPRWGVVWLDAVATWLALAASVAIAIAAEQWGVLASAVVAGVTIVPVGVAIHRLGLFVHEGVHRNVAPGRANDVVTNLLGGVATLTDVRDYRPIHMAHHRYLGTAEDTERTYMARLDLQFVARAMIGLHVRGILRHRKTMDFGRRHRSVVVSGALFHVAIVLLLVWTGHLAAAAAWCAGVLVCYPLVQSSRQLLEHRPDDAVGNLSAEGAALSTFTRLFSDDPVGPFIGGAGFNRHLLHHWDPGLSYTRFRAMDAWLRGTSVAEIMGARCTSYAATFRRLWGR